MQLSVDIDPMSCRLLTPLAKEQGLLQQNTPFCRDHTQPSSRESAVW